MKCSRCDQEARGICRFCGRALCQDHQQNRTFVLTTYIGSKKVPKSLVVADALYCGICKPQPEPIEMPYLA